MTTPQAREGEYYPDVLLRTMPMHLGLHVDHVGEDGEIMVLGHPGFHAATEAMRARYTEAVGEYPPYDTVVDLREGWAYVVEETSDGEWRLRWTENATDPWAFPVTRGSL